MLSIGLCSISFRQKSVDEVIAISQAAGLAGIEWGGDVHVPPNDPAWAKTVYEKTRAAGLELPSYGSYYRCDASQGDFKPVLETAEALGAPVIRVWAGSHGSEEAEPSYREEVATCLRAACDLAFEKGVTIALEYHGGTLTDTQDSAHRLLEEVDRPELKLYWQPRTGGRFEDDIPELRAALPALAHVHVFHWGPGGGGDRRPLAEGAEDWQRYIEIIRQAKGDRFLIFEFMKDDSPDQLREDADTLRALLEKPPQPPEA